MEGCVYMALQSVPLKYKYKFKYIGFYLIILISRLISKYNIKNRWNENKIYNYRVKTDQL